MDRQAKRHRSTRRQLGQFLTPPAVARSVVEPLLTAEPRRILEPSFGDGAFVLPLIESLLANGEGGSENHRLGRVLTERLWGVEIDPELYERCLARIAERWGPLPSSHNLVLDDYFRVEPPLGGFDLIVGNPPFGGTFDPELEDHLDRRFGRYRGAKLKKETYAFFVAKALDELSPASGTLAFICSDTFLTIKTMKGLRHKLMDHGTCSVDRLDAFSRETVQPMVVLTVAASGPSEVAQIFGHPTKRVSMEKTANFSWSLSGEMEALFTGPTLGDFLVATGGMTIGKNELFVREVVDGKITEPYDFEFFADPVTLTGELERARLGKLSRKVQERYRDAEAAGATQRNVRVVAKDEPREIAIPNADYAPYNKANGARLFAPVRHVVFWKDDGDAVLTFKRNGRWYLRGVGGRPYFFREGITWQLVAARINARYLPDGQVLDSGAPCAFLRDGVDPDELWFILGWLQTALASRILKEVINHTRNIQGKDLERLPYPVWVGPDDRRRVAAMVRTSVQALMGGESVDAAALEAELDVLCAAPVAVAAA